MMIGAILAKQFMPTDAAAMLGALVGLVVGFIWVKGHTASSGYFLQQQPIILRLAT